MNESPQTTGVTPRFSADALRKAEEIFKRYPADRRPSAIIPLLHLAQQEFGGWVSREAMDLVAEMTGVAPMRVYEVATFYTMFNLKPVGKYHVQVCTNISCWLCGSDGIAGALKKRLEVDFGNTTKDGRFTLTEVECLGACVHAPMMQINDDYHEHLTPESAVAVLDKLP